MKKTAVLWFATTLSCGNPATTESLLDTTSTEETPRTHELTYTMTNSQDVTLLWNALKIPEKFTDPSYSVKEYSSSGAEASLVCRYPKKPPSAESDKGFCKFTVDAGRNGQNFKDENSAKILYEALNLTGNTSRSGSIKFFESSDKKIQIYCAYQNIPVVPYKYFCWFKITQ